MNDNERFEQITKTMVDLHAKKNSNYGNSFSKLYSDLGPISGLVPLHNKLDRLTNLIKGGENNFESIEDTLIDLANYAIMNLIEIQKSKEVIKEDKKDDESQDLTEYYKRTVSPDTWDELYLSPKPDWSTTHYTYAGTVESDDEEDDYVYSKER